MYRGRKTAAMAATTVYPLLWSDDVGAIMDWAIASLGLSVAWLSASELGAIDHAELSWHGGRVSVNVRQDMYADMGPSGIALRLEGRAAVDASHVRASAAGARIVRPPEESDIAYSFTLLDPDGNQWWVHAETGMLDSLRDGNSD